MSTEPATRSSVALSGRVTIRTRRETTGSSSPSARLATQSSHGWTGSQEKGQSPTTSISGRSAARPRTAVDLPVPLGPTTSTPPTAGLTALSRSAVFRRSCSTSAVSG